MTETSLTPADYAAIERALDAVQRQPVPPQASYLSELFQRFIEALTAGVGRLVEAVGARRSLLAWVVAGLVALAVVAVVWFVRRLWTRRRSFAAARVMEAHEPALKVEDAASWRQRLEACLDAGQVALALEAVWWWIARTLVRERALADWTSRELAAHSGRADLLPLLRRLDALAFSGRDPEAADVRALWSRLETAL